MADKTLVWIIVAVLAVGWVMGWWESFGLPAPNLGSGSGGPSEPTTTGGCAVNPSIVTVVSDKLQAGNSYTPTVYYRLNGVYVGTTAPTTLGTVETLVTNTSMLNVVGPTLDLSCGTNLLTASTYIVANATQTIYSNSGLLALTNSATGGTYNETAAAAGGSYTWKFHMAGVDKKSTGKMMVVVELSEPANVTTLTMSDATEVTVPNGYSRQLTNGLAKAFVVDAIVGNTVRDHYIVATAASSKLITDAVYTTTYSMQPFVETDGTFNAGDVPFNSLNTAKYATYQTYDFFIA